MRQDSCGILKFILSLKGKTANLVVRLMEKILGKGHNLYVDNFYSSEQLFKYLSDNQTGACVTVRSNRLKLPAEFKKRNWIKVRRHQSARITF